MRIIHPTPINRAIAHRVRGRRAPKSVGRVGEGQSPLHPDLVSWVGDDPRTRPDRDPATLAPSVDLLTELARHLEMGDTHYTTRPGLVELRSRIASALARLGLPDFGSEGVVVTAGEGEALFAVLLSLGVTNGGTVRLLGEHGRHEPLLTMLGVTLAEPESVGGPGASGASADTGLQRRVVSLWKAIGSRDPRIPAGCRPDDVFIGTLDGLPGMPPFRLGFAAGPQAPIRRVMTWKQAWSICSAGPSQRAALFAFEGAEPAGPTASAP